MLQKVADAGYDYTFVDQMRHITKWFGRTSALGNDGYRINQINGANTFVINDSASSYLMLSDDNGSPVLSRQLLSRKARDSQQDQVLIFMNDWENFGTMTNADNYDKNMRWLGAGRGFRLSPRTRLRTVRSIFQFHRMGSAINGARSIAAVGLPWQT